MLTRRLTIRVRLTLSYAGLVTGAGGVLITLVYLYMRFVPSYHLMPIPDVEDVRAVSASPEAGVVAPDGGIAITSAEDFLRNLLMASLGALVLLAAAGAGVGWIVAGRIIAPLAVINAAATRAATGALDHRVDLDGPRDEIRDLSDTFDRMLASLERSFDAHRRFAANASHELRTPLATTKTMIDVTLADPAASAGQLRALAERVREVNRASIDTVEALLDLADADTGTSAREPISLAGMAGACAGELAAEAASGAVTLGMPTGEAVAAGDPVLVRHAVSNLLRNAVRHNRPGGRVTVRLSAGDGIARITVANTGEPIGAEAIATMTEPFSRGRGRSLTRGDGHGLGLAIVSAVADAHDGTLTLRADPDGGLTAELALPAASGES
ncbi:sensor histidine kinase [Catenuloplanes indicus]|uniref:histidine kinase n=1 Tax=Catenuloplanes indicus TaxID=137267 RepID=A0AAE3VWG2_9ACTN|nr:HAMP domain-containing sensor histidine kinase [Catenuloplanes indicus]MDQ0365004.1 two-component system sensor histidine kinase VanS [Catenuloplanes indicus]